MSTPPQTPVKASVTRRGHGSVGLYNQGATCYLNSLLQLLFHTTYFRTAVYKMTTDSDEVTSVPKALQLLFYQMQERDTAFNTKVLTDAFGWTSHDVMVQHDIHELITLLRDTIETKMKGTPAEGAVNRLFSGMAEKFFRCLDGTYTSRTREVFYDVQVQVQGFDDLMTSLKSTLQTEMLTGSNKYRVEEEGKPPVYKDAETGSRFLKFPPVILCHLKRIDIDLESPTLEQKKINTPFSYPEVLDLREIEAGLPSDDAAASPLVQGALPSDALYDLYGVIVHRGGVRSGHYFCYLRDRVAGSAAWGDWIEFDDEAVRYVDKDTAVDTNFGGFVYRTSSNGYRVQVPSAQNAYILAYVRRGETERVLYEERTDNISQDVKEEFERLVAREEELRREAERAAQQCTIHVITDADIKQHVQRNKFDMGQGREPAAAHVVKVEKKDTWNSALERIAAAMQLPAPNIRVWMCENRALQSYGQGWRILPHSTEVIAAFPHHQPRAESTVFEEVGRRFRTTPPASQWTVSVYVEVAQETAQHTLTNAATYSTPTMSSANREDNTPMGAIRDCQICKFAAEDPKPTFAMTLERVHSVQAVSFRVNHNRSLAAGTQSQLLVVLYHGRDMVSSKQVTVEMHSHQYESVAFEFNNVQCNRVEIIRTSAAVMYPQGQMRTPEPLMLSRVSVIVPPSELAHYATGPTLKLGSVKQNNILVLLKYFNHVTDTLSYVGSCVIPNNEPLRSSVPILTHLAGVSTAQAKFAVFEERSPTEIVEVHLNGYPTDVSRNQPNYVRNGAILILQEDPKKIPLMFAHPRVDMFLRTFSDVRHMNVRQLCAPDTVVSIVPMQGRWKFARVVDSIANAVNADTDYVRFYTSASVRHPAPRDEPERSDTKMSLSEMSSVNEWPTNDVWYEVLSVPRREVEETVYVKVTITDERGNVAQDEHRDITFSLPHTATAADVVTGALQRAEMPFEASYALLVIYDKVIRHVFPVFPRTGSSEPIHRYFTRHSDRSFEIRPYHAPDESEIQYTASIGSFGNPTTMHGTPFLLNLPKCATPQDALDAMKEITNTRDEDLDQYKIMMYTTAALYYRDFSTPLTEYWALTPSTYRPSLMLDCKKPKEKPGSRYVSYNDPTLSIDKKRNSK
jgi:ubiquitin C-terminal hydrolase